ncbi:15324_t:CDS:2 [Entrophospora sp. SA101]|nr:15324_t:CDS:2 [Entrophospora sp. SA101]
MGTFGSFFSEALGTFFLLLVILAVTDERNELNIKPVAPIIIGLALATIALSLGYETGFSLNGARDFGPRLFTFLVGYGVEVFSTSCFYFWIPIVAPVVGGLVAGLEQLEEITKRSGKSRRTQNAFYTVKSLECWGVIRCGLNISRPKWCTKTVYNEIQQICKRRIPYKSPGILKDLVKLNNTNELENKLKSINQRLEDPITTFSIEILIYLFEFVYPDGTIIQRGNISESTYRLYVIDMCLMKLLSGLQADLIYKP